MTVSNPKQTPLLTHLDGCVSNEPRHDESSDTLQRFQPVELVTHCSYRGSYKSGSTTCCFKKSLFVPFLLFPASVAVTHPEVHAVSEIPTVIAFSIAGIIANDWCGYTVIAGTQTKRRCPEQ